jgi:hypothetical protein
MGKVRFARMGQEGNDVAALLTALPASLDHRQHDLNETVPVP